MLLENFDLCSGCLLRQVGKPLDSERVGLVRDFTSKGVKWRWDNAGKGEVKRGD